MKRRLEELEKRLPPGYRMAIVRDQSTAIENATHSVQEHLILGSILAALVVLLFLGTSARRSSRPSPFRPPSSRRSR